MAPDDHNPGGGSEDPHRTPLGLLAILWERKWIVAATIVVCAGAAIAVSQASPKQYSSTSELLLRDPGFGRTLFGSDLFEAGDDSARATSTTIAVIESPDVTSRVQRKVDSDLSATDLASTIVVDAGENSDVVSITATTENAPTSADIANAYATEYIDYQQELDRKKVRDAQRVVEQRLETATGAEDEQLEDSLEQLTVLEAVQTGNADVIAQAAPDDTPSSTRPVEAGVLGTAIGLLLGVALALLLDLVDRRLKGSQDFERAFGHPVLVAIPPSAAPKPGTQAVGPQSEPYRMLRESLRFLEVTGTQRCILVTSPDAGEGKTTVAVNLARALVAGGKRVILLEADLRWPDALHQLGLKKPSVGLSGAIVGSRSLEEILLDASGDGALRLAPTGAIPSNPADLLRTSRMEPLVDEARALADMVIIDASPLLPVSDTRVLLDLPNVDGVVIVGRDRSTRRDRAREAARILEQSSRLVLGVALTDAREGSAGYYYASSQRGQRNGGDGRARMPGRLGSFR